MEIEIPHFIIIDDDAINNMFCRFSIMKHFPQVRGIETFLLPETALEAIAKGMIHKERSKTILFLDINMPSMTGWEFLEAFATFNEAIRSRFTIFILSSSVDARDREKAAANPLISGYLTKPLTTTAMERVLGKLQEQE